MDYRSRMRYRSSFMARMFSTRRYASGGWEPAVLAFLGRECANISPHDPKQGRTATNPITSG